ncbi:non-specific protein-tyrosine kinase [Novosphingobium sp. Rr 2-17]|nr:non-specific protein-tyrosine kinase [Novosphingobium sp. Rr 2-17]
MASIASADVSNFGVARVEMRRRLLPEALHVWMVFRRQQWIFLGVFILVLSAVLAAMLVATPVYVATASVLIEPRKTDTIDLQSVVQGLPADTNVVDTQTQIIASPTTTLAVVRQLHLDRDRDFAGEVSSLPAGAKLDKADSNAGGVTGKFAGAGETILSMTAAERRAALILQSIVTVRRQGLTYVIDISARSSDASRAAAIANAYASQYIARQSQQRVGMTKQAADFVASRAEELRKQAVADDAGVQTYMIAHNLMSAEGATMAEQEASQLNRQISDAQANLAQERGKLAAARGQINRGGGSDIGAVLASDTIRTLRAQEATASAAVASLGSKYGENYPDLQRARQNLADVRQQLGAEQNRIISTLQANVQVAESGVASLQSSQSRARGSLVSNSQAQVGLLELQRKAEASRAIYQSFLQRAKETSAATDLPNTDASISSMARLPDSAVWPDYRLGLIVGAAAALALALIAVGIAEYLDDTVATRDEVENDLAATYVGALPELASSAPRPYRSLPPHDYVLERPFSLFAESVRAAGAIMISPRLSHGQVIAITSSLPGEGKTSFAICLARLLAAGGRKVALVDGDLRRHALSAILLPEQGDDERLLDVLDGHRTLDQAFVRDTLVDLMILPTAGLKGTEDHLTDERVKRLYDALRARFDVVIVDTAPVLGVVEARLLAANADGTLLLCRWRKTATKAAQAAISILDHAGVRKLGVALSRVNIRQYASAGRNDANSYQKSFANYYAS